MGPQIYLHSAPPLISYTKFVYLREVYQIRISPIKKNSYYDRKSLKLQKGQDRVQVNLWLLRSIHIMTDLKAKERLKSY